MQATIGVHLILYTAPHLRIVNKAMAEAYIEKMCTR